MEDKVYIITRSLDTSSQDYDICILDHYKFIDGVNNPKDLYEYFVKHSENVIKADILFSK